MEQLMGLATCLSYVQGEAVTSTKDCFGGLKQVVEKNSTDPNLCIKINTSISAKLPHSCSASVDILHCPKIFSYFFNERMTCTKIKGHEKNRISSTTNSSTSNLSCRPSIFKIFNCL
ncbi:hypothetical protein AMTRI_Chr06g199150 [Amborella trichopoda]